MLPPNSSDTVDAGSFEKVIPSSIEEDRDSYQKWLACRKNDDEAFQEDFGNSAHEAFWAALINSLRQGVVVVSHDLQPVLINPKARDICWSLDLGEGRSYPTLPSVVMELCHRLLKMKGSSQETLVMECVDSRGQSIRIYANWLHFHPYNCVEEKASHILITLENCQEILWEDLRIERKKYDLTDRESEIWMMLRQEFSYQEIAQTLQISLNTVKTHVKNLYAKKRSFQGQEKTVVF